MESARGQAWTRFARGSQRLHPIFYVGVIAAVAGLGVLLAPAWTRPAASYRDLLVAIGGFLLGLAALSVDEVVRAAPERRRLEAESDELRRRLEVLQAPIRSRSKLAFNLGRNLGLLVLEGERTERRSPETKDVAGDTGNPLQGIRENSIALGMHLWSPEEDALAKETMTTESRLELFSRLSRKMERAGFEPELSAFAFGQNVVTCLRVLSHPAAREFPDMYLNVVDSFEGIRAKGALDAVDPLYGQLKAVLSALGPFRNQPAGSEDCRRLQQAVLNVFARGGSWLPASS